MSEWISVDEYLPEQKQMVWVYDSSAVFETATQRAIIFRKTDKIWHDGTITHWMPMPEPPNKIKI